MGVFSKTSTAFLFIKPGNAAPKEDVGNELHLFAGSSDPGFARVCITNFSEMIKTCSLRNNVKLWDKRP